MNDLITIIIPCYNATETIGACIESVLKQTYNNWELIIIDDGSIDDSYNAALAYAINDSRIKVVKQKNSGVSVARNTGIKLSNGKYVAFLDADDWYNNNFLNEMYSSICNYNSDIACCGYRLEMFDSSHDVISGKGDICYQGEEYLYQIMFGNNVRGFVWNKLIRKDTIKNVSFSKELKLCEDMLFCCDIYNENIKMSYVDKPMYHYKIVGTGATQNDSVIISKNGGLQVIDNYRLIENHLPIRIRKNIVNRLCGESLINILPTLNNYNRRELLKQIRDVFFPFFFTNAKFKTKLKFIYAVLIISLEAR